MNGLHIVILGLAIWRMSSLVAREEGPGDFFLHMRRLNGVYYGQDGEVIARGQLAKLITCVWCQSVWWSAIASALYVYGMGLSVWWWMPLTLALSAIAIIADEKLTG